jgi:hypothetical protein
MSFDTGSWMKLATASSFDIIVVGAISKESLSRKIDQSVVVFLFLLGVGKEGG